MNRFSLVVALGMTVLAVVPALTLDTAQAQSRRWMKPNGGYCPAGTCNIHGGRWANNVRNCNASHCGRH